MLTHWVLGSTIIWVALGKSPISLFLLRQNGNSYSYHTEWGLRTGVYGERLRPELGAVHTRPSNSHYLTTGAAVPGVQVSKSL